MARIETQSAVQMILPESSTVYVFTKQKEAKKHTSDAFAYSNIPSLFDQPLIAGVVQDRLDRGAEDMDGSGHLARFESRVRELKTQGAPYHKVVTDINFAIGEIRLEGRTFESRSPVLNEIKTVLMSLVDEIMTEPIPTQPSPNP